MLLTPQLLQRLEQLAIGVRRRLAGLHPGEHRSRKLGTSVDFADWRPYVSGDDFRRIDYQIYARLDRLVVRLYEAEEELDLRILLDASESMAFHGKLLMAKKTAATFAYLASLRRDRARVWVFDSDGVRPSPWARSRETALRLIDWIEAVEGNGEGRPGVALSRLTASGVPAGLTILISDLLTDEWESAVRRLAGPGADAAMIHVLAEDEKRPELRGDLMLVDSESEVPLEVSMSDSTLRDYGERVASWLDAVSGACRRRGIAYHLLDPTDDLEDLFMIELRRAGLVR